VVTAPIAGTGAADHAGASTVPGPCSGSGGTGNGTGSGDAGDGDGDGGDYTPPEHRRGQLKMSDLPQSAEQAGIGGTVGVRYLVDTDGRVLTCAITRSSGNAELDATTCRLIQQRFRFAPSRDGRGRPVRAYVVESHSWDIQHVAADADD
jgi:protein TonB